MACVVFLLLSELTELWKAIVVLCEVTTVSFKLVVVFSTGLTLLVVFLVTLVLLVVDLQVVLLLGAEVECWLVGDLLCMLVESTRRLEGSSWIIGPFFGLLVFCLEVGGGLY